MLWLSAYLFRLGSCLILGGFLVSPRSRSSRDPWQTNIICELGERVSVALFCLMPTRPLLLQSSCWRTQSPSSPAPHQFYVSTGIVFIWFRLSFCLCRLTEFLGAIFHLRRYAFMCSTTNVNGRPTLVQSLTYVLHVLPSLSFFVLCGSSMGSFGS